MMNQVKKILLILSLLSTPAYASDLVFQFKNPSFSGNNASAHWLTIDNQEQARKKVIQDKLEADLKAAATEEKNSILNRFINNLQSRIYSQLASQLTTDLFANKAAKGSFELDGNKIEYIKTDTDITLTITEPNGNQTIITMPISGFGF
jgi:hypothetical protein